jgi:hypothetical protein
MQTDLPSAAGRSPIVAGVFLASLTLYALTCAPGVVWQDSAIFQMRVAQFDLHSRLGLALVHPLYIILCKVFTLLPLGSQAHRVNLFSGFCAAGCLAILADLLLNMTRDRVATLGGVALLAVSHTFWKHAVLAEVMTLYGLGLAAELWLVERFLAKGRNVYLIAAFFVNGLGASNHLLALLHLPAYAGLLFWLGIQRRIGFSSVVVYAGAYLVGAAPYLSLCMEQVVRGRPIGEVVHSALFGEMFGSAVLNTSISIKREAARTVGYFVLNFPTPIALAAFFGGSILRRGGPQAVMLLFTKAIFLVNFIFAVRYLVPDQYVFFFPCYVLTALFTGLGIWSIRRGRAAQARRSRGAVAVMLFALLPALAYEVVPGLLKRYKVSAPFRQDVPYRDAFIYFLRPRMNGDDGAERFAREALTAMPPKGVLIADSSENNALAYVRDIEGVRQDVVLTVPFDGELADPKVERSREGIRPFLDAGLAYSTMDREPYLLPWMAEDLDLKKEGVIFKLSAKRARGR